MPSRQKCLSAIVGVSPEMSAFVPAVAGNRRFGKVAKQLGTTAAVLALLSAMAMAQTTETPASPTPTVPQAENTTQQPAPPSSAAPTTGRTAPALPSATAPAPAAPSAPAESAAPATPATPGKPDRSCCSGAGTTCPAFNPDRYGSSCRFAASTGVNASRNRYRTCPAASAAGNRDRSRAGRRAAGPDNSA